MGYVITAILIYLLYRFITCFVIPVARTTSQVKRQFNQMREEMERQQNGYQPENASQSGHPSQKPRFDIEGEYIQFEEVK